MNYDVMTNSYSLRNIYYWGNHVFDETIEQKDFEMQTKSKGKVADSAPSGFLYWEHPAVANLPQLKSFQQYAAIDCSSSRTRHDHSTITYIVVPCVPNSNFRVLYKEIGEAIDFVLGKRTML